MAARITDMIREATGGDHPGKTGGPQRRFAETVGTDPVNVSRWRKGSIPEPRWWPGLARALGVTEDEIAAACEGGVPIERQLTVIVAMLEEQTKRVAALHADVRHLLPSRPGRRATS